MFVRRPDAEIIYRLHEAPARSRRRVFQEWLGFRLPKTVQIKYSYDEFRGGELSIAFEEDERTLHIVAKIMEKLGYRLYETNDLPPPRGPLPDVIRFKHAPPSSLAANRLSV